MCSAEWKGLAHADSWDGGWFQKTQKQKLKGKTTIRQNRNKATRTNKGNGLVSMEWGWWGKWRQECRRAGKVRYLQDWLEECEQVSRWLRQSGERKVRRLLGDGWEITMMRRDRRTDCDRPGLWEFSQCSWWPVRVNGKWTCTYIALF